MTDATMRGLLRSAAHRVPLLALLAFSTAVVSSAEAQTTGTGSGTTTQSSNQAIDSNLVVRRNGDIIKNGTLVYADIADCGGDPKVNDGNEFEFSVTYTANAPVVELWLGVGNSENCTQSSSRIKQTNGTLPPLCTFLGSVTTGTRNPSIRVKGSQLFDQTGWNNDAERLAPDNAGKFKCDETSGLVPYTVYMIPLQTSTTAANGTEPITIGVLSTLKATFSPYTQRPAPPTSLSGASGETKLTVSFKAPSSSMTLTKYKAYFDVRPGQGNGATGGANVADAGVDAGTTMITGGLDAGLDAGVDAGTSTGASSGATAACGSGRLVGDQPPPVNQAEIRESKEGTSTSIALTDLSGVDIGQIVAAAVVSIDPAGNESNLSTPICIPVVETTGFVDACRNTPGCIEELDGCSLNPRRSGSAWSLSMVALALAALIRRRGRA